MLPHCGYTLEIFSLHLAFIADYCALRGASCALTDFLKYNQANGNKR